ncbi:MAG TPA: VWA domain-containing protein, partial [Xanthomonadaceae bacterium]|nr:VWA domain-containing protein [Xanthomonadaceae bacterium]
MSVSTLATVIPHLLRPFWLLAMLALPLLWWLRRRHANRETPWRHAVDAHLLPSLLQAAPTATQRVAWLFGTAYALSVFALAGPSWRQQPAPLYAPAAPLVVVMDVSSHMLAADLPPSRLLRARLKIEQLLAVRKGGQIGLVAYAGDAFTVAPLSDDANNLRDLLATLAPDTMPVDGQRADRAIRRATDLLAQAGHAHGQILVLSDDADPVAQAAARDASAKGYIVDAIGVGTASGAPLPALDG